MGEQLKVLANLGWEPIVHCAQKDRLKLVLLNFSPRHVRRCSVPAVAPCRCDRVRWTNGSSRHR